MDLETRIIVFIYNVDLIVTYLAFFFRTVVIPAVIACAVIWIGKKLR